MFEYFAQPDANPSRSVVPVSHAVLEWGKNAKIYRPRHDQRWWRKPRPDED